MVPTDQHLTITDTPTECPELVVFRVNESRYSGPTPRINVGALRDALANLPDEIREVAFVFGSGDLIAGLDDPVCCGAVSVVARGVAVTEAIKVVKGDRVTGSVDRSNLRVVTGPEVALREVLESALADQIDSDWVNITALIGGTGAPVAVLVD